MPDEGHDVFNLSGPAGDHRAERAADSEAAEENGKTTKRKIFATPLGSMYLTERYRQSGDGKARLVAMSWVLDIQLGFQPREPWESLSLRDDGFLCDALSRSLPFGWNLPATFHCWAFHCQLIDLFLARPATNASISSSVELWISFACSAIFLCSRFGGLSLYLS
jgi:hypothetical protein